jgi:hypothetical protein
MTLEWRTYNTIPNYFKVTDPFLANTQVLIVEQDGVEHDGRVAVPSGGDRGYFKALTSPTISFGILNPFTDGARVYVLVKY